MKRTKKMMLVTLMATTAIAMLLMSKAFAAPAGTTAATCPTQNLLTQLVGGSGASLPTSVTGTSGTCPKTQMLQQLLGQYGLNQPTAGSTTGSCPKSQSLQDLLNQLGIKLPGAAATPAPTGTTAPTGTPAPVKTPAPTATPAPTTAPVSGNMSADEQKMINLVNQDRAANGLKPVTFDAGLRAGALAHSQDMSQNNYFSHTSPTQGDFSARIRASGVKYTSAGENIAMYGSVESAETGFMNSPGHRANILGNFTRVGIGIVYNQSKGAYYITQWFAN